MNDEQNEELEQFHEPDSYSANPETEDYEGEIIRLDFEVRPDLKREYRMQKAARLLGMELPTMAEFSAICRVTFDNGHECSVLRYHPGSFRYLHLENKIQALFEIWKSSDSEPQGYLTFLDVQAHLRCLQRQPKRGC